MLKRDRRKSHRDFSLCGVALCGTSILVTYAMHAEGERSTGLVGKLVCEPLFAMFADLAWLVPIIIGLLGIILICESSEPTVAVAMSLAANCYLLLFATICHVGTIGQALANVSVFLFGDLSGAVVDGLFSILTFSMLGISSRQAVAKACRITSRIFSRLWDIRLPNLKTLFASGKRACTDKQTASYTAPIPLYCSITAAQETVMDARFVETPVREVRRAYTNYRLPNLSFFNQPIVFRGPIENKARLGCVQESG